MGRGRIELRRIENKINREVTFCKRRNGMLKKAYELSLLCDADVALIIFSNQGKLYEFCSTSSMAETLERYQRCSYGPIEAQHSPNYEMNNYQEYLKLKEKVEALQQSQRHLLGENLGKFDAKELDQLENVLETSLRQVRLKQSQQMFQQVSHLQQKGKYLMEINQALRSKFEGGSKNKWLQETPVHPDQVFFETLHVHKAGEIIGYSSVAANNNNNTGGGSTTQNGKGVLPGWMH